MSAWWCTSSSRKIRRSKRKHKGKESSATLYSGTSSRAPHRRYKKLCGCSLSYSPEGPTLSVGEESETLRFIACDFHHIKAQVSHVLSAKHKRSSSSSEVDKPQLIGVYRKARVPGRKS